MRLLPYGRDGLLVELADASAVARVSSALAADPRFVEVVPGARTVLVRTRDVAGARAALPGLLASADGVAGPDDGEVALDVVYDGADLLATADQLGMTVPDLVAMHCGASYVVAFCGFAPGFAYLTGLPSALHVPRLAEPRTRVPAGAVAIAGEFAGVYPRSSPGGWRLLGSTDATVWDVTRDPPALLTPGTRVRFRERQP